MKDEQIDGMDDGGESFGEIVRRVHHDLGGRADIAATAKAVRQEIDSDLYDAIVAPGFASRCRSELKHRDEDSGLPYSLQVNGDYVALVLFSVDEYREAVRKYVGRARANRIMAQRLADECESVHGVAINVDEAAS